MLCVCDHAVEPLLHVPLVRELPVQPLLAGLQLLLQTAFVLLVDLGGFLQNVNLQGGRWRQS